VTCFSLAVLTVKPAMTNETTPKFVERRKSLLSSDTGENTAVLRQNLVTIVFYVDLSSLDILKKTVR
jgi:hypothetical protein